MDTALWMTVGALVIAAVASIAAVVQVRLSRRQTDQAAIQSRLLVQEQQRNEAVYVRALESDHRAASSEFHTLIRSALHDLLAEVDAYRRDAPGAADRDRWRSDFSAQLDILAYRATVDASPVYKASVNRLSIDVIQVVDRLSLLAWGRGPRIFGRHAEAERLASAINALRAQNRVCAAQAGLADDQATPT